MATPKKRLALRKLGALIQKHNEAGPRGFADCFDPNCTLCAAIHNLARDELGVLPPRKSGPARLEEPRSNRDRYKTLKEREMNRKTNSLVLKGLTPERFKRERATLYGTDAALCKGYGVPQYALTCFKKIFKVRAAKSHVYKIEKAEYLAIAPYCATDSEAAKKLSLPLPTLRKYKRLWGLTAGRRSQHGS